MPSVKQVWSSLKCADGRADDLPRIIEDLGHADPTKRTLAAAVIEQQLYRAQKWFSAAPPAVALLNQLLEGSIPDKHRVLALLADLSTADHTLYLSCGVQRKQPDVRKRYARGTGKAVLAEVVAATPRYLSLVADADPKTRGAAAFLLAFLPEVGDSAYAAIEQALVEERDAVALSNQLIALGFVAWQLGRTDDALKIAERQAAHSSALVVGASALVRAGLLDEPDERWSEALEGLVTSRELHRDVFPWNHGKPAGLIAKRLERFAAPGRALAARVVARAASQLGALPTAETPAAVLVPQAELTDLALSLVFSGPVAAADALSADQRLVLEELSQFSMVGGFHRYGIPDAVRARRRFIGLDPPGPLGQPMTIRLEGAERQLSVGQLVDELMRQRAPEAAIFETLSGALPPKELLKIYGELPWVPAAERALRFEELLRHSGPETVAWAESLLSDLLRFETAMGGGTLEASAPLMARAHELSDEAWLDEKYDRLISFAGALPPLRSILAKLPEERRQAFLVAALDRARNDPLQGATWTLRRAFGVVDLCPSDAVFTRIAQMLTEAYLTTEVGPYDAKPRRDQLLAELAAVATEHPAVASGCARHGLVAEG